uniref:Uncharacterized protein n=1 Tax=Zooxanthella nutricula TaxID=1333877 RepID=A0A7S2Q8A5_9DINO
MGKGGCLGGAPAEAFVLGEAAGRVILAAKELGVPVCFTQGALVPWAVRSRPERRGCLARMLGQSTRGAVQQAPAAEGEGSPGDGPRDAAAETSEPSGEDPATAVAVAADAPAPEPEEPELDEVLVLRAAARTLVRWQAFAVARWAVLLATLRLADLSLALASLWHWDDAILCVCGAVLATAISAIVMLVTAQYYRGQFPLRVACALPGSLLAIGGLALALFVYCGVMALRGLEHTASVGILDLTTDELARHVAHDACSTDLCRRSVFFFASFAQTLLVAGWSSAVVAAFAALCPRRLASLRSWAAGCVVGTLGLALAFALARAGYQADGLGGVEARLPEAQLSFAMAVYLITQAAARFAAPVCALLSVTSRWGLRVLVPCQLPRPCRRRDSTPTRMLGPPKALAVTL